MSIDTAIWAMFMVGFFGGLMFGCMMSQRQNPNAPKPKNWEGKLHKEWMNGFKTGEKSMAKRMSERLKREEIYNAMREEVTPHE